MTASKRSAATHSTLSDLKVRFEQYGLDTPENSFPSFLETLLFDLENGKPAARPSQRSAGHARTRPAEAEYGQAPARLHPSSSARH